MTAFPQLSSGAVAQFPFARSVRFRTLLNRFAGGAEIRFSDLEVEERRWEIVCEELTDAEWEAIRTLFEQSEGRLGTFVFVEPGQNLLAWSGELGQAVWTKSGVSVTDGEADPEGGAAGSRISGSGSVQQTLEAPGAMRLTGSVWARTSGSGAGLTVSDGAGVAATQNFEADGQWRRYEVSYPGGSAAEQTVFELFSNGSDVDVYGPQLEAQPAASVYKPTAATGGVFAGARFDQDVLEDRLVGVGRHSGVVRIQWQRSQV